MSFVHKRPTANRTVMLAELAFLVAMLGMLVSRSTGAGDEECFKKLEDQWCALSDPCACAPAGHNAPDYIAPSQVDIELPGWTYVHNPNQPPAFQHCYNKGACQLNTDADPCYIDPNDETIYYPSAPGGPVQRFDVGAPNVGAPCPLGPVT